MSAGRCPQGLICSRIERIDGRTGRVEQKRSTSRAAVDLAVADRGLWELSDLPDGSPYHLTLRNTTTLEERMDVVIPSKVTGNGSPGAHLAPHGDVVWVALQDGEGCRVVAVNGSTGAIEATIPLTNDQAAEAITVDDGGVWVVPSSGTRLLRIEPQTHVVTQSTDLGGERLLDASSSDDSVWVVVANPGFKGTSVLRLDSTGTRVTARLPVAATSVFASARGVWALGDNPTASAADADGGVVRLLDVSNGTVIARGRIPPPSPGARVAADDAGFVVADEAGSVSYLSAQ